MNARGISNSAVWHVQIFFSLYFLREDVPENLICIIRFECQLTDADGVDDEGAGRHARASNLYLCAFFLEDYLFFVEIKYLYVRYHKMCVRVAWIINFQSIWFIEIC